ncbi:MAG: glycosyltransferase family 39 protein [Elusimicrobiota bacterium]
MKSDLLKSITVVFLLEVIAVLGVTSIFDMNILFPRADDAADYAQIAQQITNGKGFTSRTMNLPGIAYLHEKNYLYEKDWPSILRFPLPSLIMAGLFFILKDWGLAISMYSCIFYLLSIPAVFLLSKKLFNIKTAIISSIIFTFNVQVFGASCVGMTEPCSTFLLLILIFMLIKSTSNNLFYYLSGITLGLFYLNRYTALIFLIPIIIFIYLSNHKSKYSNILKFFFSFFAVIFPWLLRNYLLCNDPFFSLGAIVGLLGRTRWFPEMFNEPCYISPVMFILMHPKEFIVKWIIQFGHFFEIFPQIGDLYYIFPFFFIGIFLKYNRETDRIKYLFLSLLLIQVLFLNFYVSDPRFYSHFIPLIIIFGTACFLHFFRSLNIRNNFLQRFLMAVFICISVFPYFFRNNPQFYHLFMGKKNELSNRPVSAEISNFEYIKKYVKQGDIIAARGSACTLLLTDCKIISIPSSPELIEPIEKKYGISIVGIYLAKDGWYREEGDIWEKIFRSKKDEIIGYKLKKVFETGELFYLKNDG